MNNQSKIEIEVSQGKKAVIKFVDDDENSRSIAVTERIKTFEDACAELGDSNPMVLAYREMNVNLPCIRTYLKLCIITEALNEGWKSQFTKGELRWHPWFYLCRDEDLSDKSDEWKQEHVLKDFEGYQGEWRALIGEVSGGNPTGAYANAASRLCYGNAALADYSGRQFAGLWADFYLNRKE